MPVKTPNQNFENKELIGLKPFQSNDLLSKAQQCIKIYTQGWLDQFQFQVVGIYPITVLLLAQGRAHGIPSAT